MTLNDDTPGEKALVRGLYDTLYESKEFDAIGEFYAPDAVRHGGLQGSLEGGDAIQGYLSASLGGLSEIEITELHCLREGSQVAFDFRMAATHSGELLNAPATGNRFEIDNGVFFEIEDGLVVDEWPRTDMLGLLEGIELVDLPL